MAFKQNKDRTLEICCMGLLRFIGRESVEISGVLMKYPEVKFINGDRLYYCPMCGKELNPEDNNKELFNGQTL